MVLEKNVWTEFYNKIIIRFPAAYEIKIFPRHLWDKLHLYRDAMCAKYRLKCPVVIAFINRHHWQASLYHY